MGLSHQTSLGGAAEEVESCGHAFEDRLGALKRQGQNEGVIRVGPGGDEKGDLPPALGEIDVDVTEISLEPLAGKMPQRNERFALSTAMLEHITLHLGVAAAVAVLIAEATIHLRRGMPLLGRGGFIIDQDLVDDRRDGTQERSRAGSGPGGQWRFSMVEGMPNGFSRVIELSGDLPDGHAIAPSSPNRAVVIHRKHFLCLRASEPIPVGTFTIHGCARVGPSYALILPPGGSLLRAHFQSFTSWPTA